MRISGFASGPRGRQWGSLGLTLHQSVREELVTVAVEFLGACRLEAGTPQPAQALQTASRLEATLV